MLSKIIESVLSDSQPTSEAVAGERLKAWEGKVYLPTPREIALRCAEIRRSWSPTERRRRRVGTTLNVEHIREWSPPIIDASYLRHAAAKPAVDD
jgi:hypothetical protein